MHNSKAHLFLPMVKNNPKGKLDKVKEDGTVKLFAVNYNVLGPYSERKIEQLKLISKIRKINGLMINSSDFRWNIKKEYENA